ncbi:A/G-specific adenine glycosylase [Nesterenkonia sp. LB17]|uniref:A/G-specific adenine glycosylase n=1 Tax=Nesterenkonia sp. LB17 TaxID=2901230 RepID=UPI001F4C5E70|nr:A/G-specific adenine glycosylase [Nesterenkonia sp. LB17]MCH8566576.1 A/G-specific adenine glycosylase [Nesterenkonia sp. LB17]
MTPAAESPASATPASPPAAARDGSVRPDVGFTPEPTLVHDRVIEWFEDNARPLPWREPGCTPWGVLVSEIMLQQTPVVRVLPRWELWMKRWPRPADLAAAPTAEILTAWDRLGYPRRALRLQAAAAAMVERHGGKVPSAATELRALPGVGEYTAAAVACFAFQEPEVVVDTNIRRVHARAFTGHALPGKTYTSAQRRLAQELMPTTEHDGGATACAWNASAMELGALICTARAPQCQSCPVADLCAWRAAGSPPPTAEQQTRGQAWAGTDRQVRGAIMAVLRTGQTVERTELLAGLALPEAAEEQRSRCLDSLLRDGLAAADEGQISLPGGLGASAPVLAGTAARDSAGSA